MTKREALEFSKTIDVSRETLQMLVVYEQMLRKWNAKINLVSDESLRTIWQRHFLDSAQLWDLSPKKGLWVDLGSGGGFPGIIIAILARDMLEQKVVLVEADQRKAAFLRSIIRELNLNARVKAERIETIMPQNADVLTARALAPLSRLLAYTHRHRRSDGLALFPKGERVEIELADALEHWRFDCQKHPSITDSKSTILSVGELSRV